MDLLLKLLTQDVVEVFSEHLPGPIYLLLHPILQLNLRQHSDESHNNTASSKDGAHDSSENGDGISIIACCQPSYAGQPEEKDQNGRAYHCAHYNPRQFPEVVFHMLTFFLLCS